MTRLAHLLLKEQSDVRLLELSAEGHEQAFEMLVRRHTRSLRRLASRIAPDSRADDIVQDTFMRAWLAVRAGTEVANPRAWLMRMAANAAMDHHRGRYDFEELRGEPLAALRRMAYLEHRQVRLHAGDTVVFSANPIPGNERAVNDTIDRLIHIGCDVVTNQDAPIHTSGHGHREELKLMLNITRPKYLMPVHGDHKRIRLHAELGEAVGIPRENIFRGDNGLPLEIDATGARFAERERSGMTFVDGIELGDPAEVALRDRRDLSADGVMFVVATVSADKGDSLADPEIVLRGVPMTEDEGRFRDSIADAVENSLDRAADADIHEPELIEKVLHDDLAEFVYRKLRRRPMIVPVVVEV